MTIRIEERLSTSSAAFVKLPPALPCERCGMVFHSKLGLELHLEEHYADTFRPVIRYYVTMAYLPAFLSESKAALWNRKGE